MCGIAGLFDASGRPVDAELVRRMTRVLSHRGPDDEGVWVDGCVGLGHRRLSIRDLSSAGHQPMSDPNGRVTISYNGEIYNDQALRRELERDHGVQFRSTCDAEVIPLGYLAWGEEVFDRLEGMFAVALWDASEECMFLARDGVGIKPLFVTRQGPRWRFGSELKALLADPEQPRRIDPESLHAYLAQGYVGPDRSLLQGVQQLPPGTVRRIDRAGWRDRRFWLPSRRPEIFDLDDAVEEFLRVWDEVLSAITVSDVPVGNLQSSGVDSSLVTMGLAAQPDIPLFTASVAERSHDEADVVKEVAHRAGRRHHIISVADEDVPATFCAVVEHFDGQLADSSGLAVYTLCREVRRHLKVVLSGDGADEYFGGYQTYGATRIAGLVRQVVPRSLLQTAGEGAWRMAAGRKERLPAAELVGRFLLAAASPTPDIHPEWRRIVPRHAIADLYGPDLAPFRDADPFAAYTAAFRAADGDLLDRCLVADQRHYLPADMLMKVDAMSMAHGLEVRVPFLERKVVDLAARIDGKLLVPFIGRQKKTLREALRRLGGPDSVVRGRKRGFNVPVVQLLSGPLAALADRLLDAEVDRLGSFLNPAGVRKAWREQREARGNHGYSLWAILALATWVEMAEL